MSSPQGNTDTLFVIVFYVAYLYSSIYIFIDGYNDGYALTITRIVSNITLVTAFGFELLAVKQSVKYEIMRRLHYIPTFVLCEFANILLVITLLKSWPTTGDTNPYSYQSIVTLGTIICYVTVNSYTDGLIIYHRLRNSEHKLHYLKSAFVGSMSTVFNIALPVSSIFFYRSCAVEYILTVCCLVLAAINTRLMIHSTPPVISNETVKLVLDFLASSDVHLTGFLLPLLKVSTYDLYYKFNLNDLDSFDREIKTSRDKYKLIFAPVVEILVLTTLRWRCLNNRLHIFPQMKSVSAKRKSFRAYAKLEAKVAASQLHAQMLGLQSDSELELSELESDSELELSELESDSELEQTESESVLELESLTDWRQNDTFFHKINFYLRKRNEESQDTRICHV